MKPLQKMRKFDLTPTKIEKIGKLNFHKTDEDR